MKNLPKVLLQILILLVPFYFLRFEILDVPTTALEVGVYIVFIYFLLSGNLNLKDKSKYLISAAVFLVLTFIAALIDPDKIGGLGLWKAYFFDGFLVFLMFLSIKDSKGFLETIFYSGVLTSALALILFFSGIRSDDGRLLDLDRLSPNYLAMFLTPILVLGVFQSFRKRNITNYIGEALIILSLALTNSRGALVALAGVIVIIINIYLKKIIPRWSKLIFVLMLSVFFIGGYAVFRPDFTDHARKSTSSNVRYYIWTTSLSIVKEKPILGIGLGNYQNYFYEKTKTWVNYPEFITPQALTAHNLFLHLMVTGGALVLIGFGYLLISSKFYRLKSPSVGLAIFAILFYGLVDTPLFRNDLAIIFWILIAFSFLGNYKNARTS